jgi:hypothetical protein
MPRLSTRQKAWTNIISLVLNEALDRGLISPTNPADDGCADAIHIDLPIGGVPASASIADCGHGELRVGVVVGGHSGEGRNWAPAGGISHRRDKLRRQIGACALAKAWVERKNGFHLQTHFGGGRIPAQLSCAAGFLPVAAALDVEPKGVATSGRFYR